MYEDSREPIDPRPAKRCNRNASVTTARVFNRNEVLFLFSIFFCALVELRSTDGAPLALFRSIVICRAARTE